MYTFEHLRQAALRARRGNLHAGGAQAFFFHLENEVAQLREELSSGAYRPGAYRYFQIQDPKSRVISVAPFRDRVVHHAVVDVLEPIFERAFIFDSYACRKGKGTHLAVRRAQIFLKNNDWYLKADVAQFFDSINHDRLLALVARKVKDRSLLDLVEKIVRNGGPLGLPIGNLTSQFFANVYLDRLDHFVKQDLGVRYYVRYMDDFVVLDTDKARLLAVRERVAVFLADELLLALKPSATFVNRRANGLPFLGTRIFPAVVRLKRPALVRASRRLLAREAAWAEGVTNDEQMLASAGSYYGHWEQYNTFRWRVQKSKAHDTTRQ
ncbi:MAG: reverse transcriptase/maturase family protein [Saprospiraceae bacterium]